METNYKLTENLSTSMHFNGVVHKAIYFGIPAAVILNIICLIVTGQRENLQGLNIYSWIATAFTLFFGLGSVLKTFYQKEYSAGGWFYAVAMGITYITCYTFTISLIVSLSIFDWWILLIVAIFFLAFNINDIINTIITSIKYSRAKTAFKNSNAYQSLEVKNENK